jgi:hypothetical protein
VLFGGMALTEKFDLRSPLSREELATLEADLGGS